jgi:hypothetical protein
MKAQLSITMLLVFFLSIAAGQSQDSTNCKPKENIYKRTIAFEAGANITGFQDFKGQEKIGFAFGFTRSFKLNDKLGLNFSGLVSRQNMLLQRVPGFGGNSEQVTRKYFDHDISVLFIEVPVFFSYQLWQRGNKSLHIALGMGVSVSVQNDSKQMNFVLTDEVLDVPSSVEIGYREYTRIVNSSSNSNAGIWLNYENCIFKVIYINKFFYFRRSRALMNYDKAHTLLLNLGYYIN